jgi:glycosyltransferase involved in cell wall biosynthesis
MSKKRILEFISFAKIGGTEQSLLRFLHHASHDKYEFFVCVLLHADALNQEVSKLNIENISLNMRGYWDLSAWWKFYRFAKRKQVDLLRTYGLKADIIGRVIGRLLGIPVNITSVRSTDPWRKWYHVLLDVLTSGLTDLYLSNSEAGRMAIHQREGIPLSKILTIPNGIDLAKYKTDNTQLSEISATYKKMFGIAPTDRVIGIVANLCKMKGHKTIIDALPRIQKVFPNIRCFFVGRDDLYGEIHNYVREKDCEHTVIFTGFRRDIPDLLPVFEVFLLPSIWEGLPTVLLEAMAMKKPVVASSVGGIPEIVEDEKTGVLIPPQDPDALAEAVIFLLKNPDIADKMGQAGYERVRRNFSLDNTVAKTETVYDRLIEQKRGRNVSMPSTIYIIHGKHDN